MGNKVRLAAAAGQLLQTCELSQQLQIIAGVKGERERSVTPVRFCHKNCRRGKRERRKGKSQRLNERLDGSRFKKGAPKHYGSVENNSMHRSSEKAIVNLLV